MRTHWETGTFLGVFKRANSNIIWLNKTTGLPKICLEAYLWKICPNSAIGMPLLTVLPQYESGKRLWLQPWWQQLHPGTCSWSWLAADTSSLDCLWDINTCSKVLFECTPQPKGQLCAPSVSKCIRINGSAELSHGGFPWVIQMTLERGGGLS